MKDQVHIRNAEAADLARTLARQTGKTISDVVLDALRQYRLAGGRGRTRRPRSAIDRTVKQWRKLLRNDRRGLARPQTPVECLYDDTTGLAK
jgi:hypothetical protein